MPENNKTNVPDVSKAFQDSLKSVTKNRGKMNTLLKKDLNSAENVKALVDFFDNHFESLVKAEERYLQIDPTKNIIDGFVFYNVNIKGKLSSNNKLKDIKDISEDDAKKICLLDQLNFEIDSAMEELDINSTKDDEAAQDVVDSITESGIKYQGLEVVQKDGINHVIQPADLYTEDGKYDDLSLNIRRTIIPNDIKNDDLSFVVEFLRDSTGLFIKEAGLPDYMMSESGYKLSGEKNQLDRIYKYLYENIDFNSREHYSKEHKNILVNLTDLKRMNLGDLCNKVPAMKDVIDFFRTSPYSSSTKNESTNQLHDAFEQDKNLSEIYKEVLSLEKDLSEYARLQYELLKLKSKAKIIRKEILTLGEEITKKINDLEASPNKELLDNLYNVPFSKKLSDLKNGISITNLNVKAREEGWGSVTAGIYIASKKFAEAISGNPKLKNAFAYFANSIDDSTYLQKVQYTCELEKFINKYKNHDLVKKYFTENELYKKGVDTLYNDFEKHLYSILDKRIDDDKEDHAGVVLYGEKLIRISNGRLKDDIVKKYISNLSKKYKTELYYNLNTVKIDHMIKRGNKVMGVNLNKIETIGIMAFDEKTKTIIRNQIAKTVGQNDDVSIIDEIQDQIKSTVKNLDNKDLKEKVAFKLKKLDGSDRNSYLALKFVSENDRYENEGYISVQRIGNNKYTVIYNPSEEAYAKERAQEIKDTYEKVIGLIEEFKKEADVVYNVLEKNSSVLSRDVISHFRSISEHNIMDNELNSIKPYFNSIPDYINYVKDRVDNYKETGENDSLKKAQEALTSLESFYKKWILEFDFNKNPILVAADNKDMFIGALMKNCDKVLDMQWEAYEKAQKNPVEKPESKESKPEEPKPVEVKNAPVGKAEREEPKPVEVKNAPVGKAERKEPKPEEIKIEEPIEKEEAPKKEEIKKEAPENVELAEKLSLLRTGIFTLARWRTKVNDDLKGLNDNLGFMLPDSPEKQGVLDAIKDVNGKVNKPETNSVEIVHSFANLYKAAENCHNKLDGKLKQEVHNLMKYSLESVMTLTSIKEFMNSTGLKTLKGESIKSSSVKDIIDAVGEYRKKDKLVVKGDKNDAVNIFTNLNNVAKDQIELINFMRKKYGFTISVDLSKNRVDDYIKIKSDPSVLDMAKYCLAADCLEQIIGLETAKDAATIQKVGALLHDENAFLAKAKELSKNSIFKNFIKEHKKDYHTAWKTVNNKAKSMREEYGEMLKEFKPNPGAYVVAAKDPEAMYQRMTSVTMAKIFSNPKNEFLLLGVAGGMYDIMDINTQVYEKLKADKALSPRDGKLESSVINMDINTGGVEKRIMDHLVKHPKTYEVKTAPNMTM